MKILVVGLGSMGKRRARLVQSMEPEAQLYGVDVNEERQAQAREMAFKQVYAVLPEALAADRYDAAFVCTAPLSHAEIIDTLLDGGIPVFTELNLVEDGYDELVQKAAEKHLPLFISSTMLYRAETKYIANEVATFAKPVNYIYHIGQYLPDWHPWESYKSYFVGDARTGGVREILAIDLPWLVSAFGPVASVCVQKTKTTGLDISYPDTCYVMLRHENGTSGFLAADVASPKAVRRFELFGEGLHIFWNGSPTTLARYDVQTKELLSVDTYTEVEHDARYSDTIVENAYRDEIREFFAVVAGKGQARWSFEKDRAVLRLIERIENGEGGCT